MTQKSWIEQQEASVLFNPSDAGQLSLHLLKVGRANRVITVGQARLLTAARLLAVTNEAWGFMGEVADWVEDYQLTIGKPENSRVSFLAGLKAELAKQMQDRKDRMTA